MSETQRIFVGRPGNRPAKGRCWITHSPARLGRGREVVHYRERPWFSGEDESLTAAEADRLLSCDHGYPVYERTMYLVFRLRAEEGERFEAEDDLYAAMLAGTRAAMRVFVGEVGADKLVWVASIRADYPNPCVKVLINRRIGHTKRGWPRLLESLPRRLRSHWAKRERENEPRRSLPGLCGEAFLEVLDAVGEQARRGCEKYLKPGSKSGEEG
jgi:hypothetical protein